MPGYVAVQFIEGFAPSLEQSCPYQYAAAQGQKDAERDGVVYESPVLPFNAVENGLRQYVRKTVHFPCKDSRLVDSGQWLEQDFDLAGQSHGDKTMI